MKQFEDVPTVQLFSARELEEQLTSIRATITDQSKDWNKRVDAVSSTSLLYSFFAVRLLRADGSFHR